MARTPQSEKPPRSAAEIVADTSASFGGLLERAGQLLRLEGLLRTLLEPELAQRFRVANVRRNRLILLVPSAAWATRLRMEAARLVDDLRRSGHAGIDTIDIRVGPLPPDPPDPPGARPLSPAARQALDLMARLGAESED